jgi:hypothetical protein
MDKETGHMSDNDLAENHEIKAYIGKNWYIPIF